MPRRQALIQSTIPLGAARGLVGAILVAKPTLLATGLGVDSFSAEQTAWIARMFAGRDLALGIGAVAGSRGCQLAGCAADVIDCAAVLAAWRQGRVKRIPAALTAATAAGAAIIGGAAYWATRA